MRPCDCRSMADVNKYLDASGFKINDNSIRIEPNVVFLELGMTRIRIPMFIFKKFADWYLEDQGIETNWIRDNDTSN